MKMHDSLFSDSPHETTPQTKKVTSRQGVCCSHFIWIQTWIIIENSVTVAVLLYSDVSLGLLTRRFLDMFLTSPDGTLDLREVTTNLQTCKRRVYDITNVLGGIRLIKKESANRIKWMWVNRWSDNRREVVDAYTSAHKNVWCFCMLLLILLLAERWPVNDRTRIWDSVLLCTMHW